MKKLFSLLLALGLTLCLTACGGSGLTAMDATGYVQGLLDKTYLGQFSESYLESVEVTKETAREDYEEGLEVEYAYFAAAFEFDTKFVTDELKQQVIDLLADIYLHSAYEVKGAVAEGKGFAVEVAVKPIDIIPLVSETYMEDFAAEFAAAFADMDLATVEAMSAEEQEAFWLSYETRWVGGIVALFREHMDELGYLEEQSIRVQFQPDEEGCYAISDEDFASIDALILAYSY